MKDLQSSGITAEVAAQHGIRTIHDAGEISSLLNWKGSNGASKLGACLYLPYYDSQGKRNGYSRLKPDCPLHDPNGKARKYLGPKQKPVRVYFPLQHVASYTDADVPLIITEGEKKALCGAIHGFVTVGLGGVSCWNRKRQEDALGKKIGKRELNQDLANLPWKGRQVYIVFDSDRATNTMVRREEYLLAEALQAQGAIVLIVQIPPAEDGKKQGLDDSLVAQGVEAFQELIAKAMAPVRPNEKQQTADALANPHRLAESFREYHSTSSQNGQLYWWNNEFVTYCHGAYQIVPQQDIKPLVTAHIRKCFQQEYREAQSRRKRTREVKGRLITDVINALQSICHLPSHFHPPAWIGQQAGLPDPHTILATRNGLLQLGDTGVVQFHPLNPDYFTFNAVPYDYAQDSSCPVQWLTFLQSLWPQDEQTIHALQEWFGYLLTANTSQQKILMLIGPKRSGKGTILRILRKLLGDSNVVNPTLTSLGGQFGLSPLIGKTVAIIADARLGNRHDQAVITERLLSISGEDVQTIDRKHRDSFTCHLPVRFVMASNEIPRMSDTSGALSGRMIILKLSNSFYGNEDLHLDRKLSGELPGILQWAIDGFTRLWQRGYFLQPESGRLLVEEMQDLLSPVGAFVQERCVLDATAVVPIKEIYQDWRIWCEDNGREHPGNLQTFGRDLHAAVASITTSRPAIHGNRTRCYLGISLKRPGEEVTQCIPSAMSADSDTAPHRESSIKHSEGHKTYATVGKTADIADDADGHISIPGVYDL